MFVVLCRALTAAALLGASAAIKVMQDGPFRHGGRPVPAPSPPPTPSPTSAPTPVPPTPAPTFVVELPGIPCPCLPPTCFAAYDLNNDSCLTQDECDLQVTLLGNCTGNATYGPPVWDTDLDGCINFTEWEDIFAATNGSVCPVEIPEPPEECEPGYYLVANPTECIECVGGEVRRRRALECTPCPDGTVDLLSCSDECVDTSAPFYQGSDPCSPTPAPECWVDPDNGSACFNCSNHYAGLCNNDSSLPCFDNNGSCSGTNGTECPEILVIPPPDLGLCDSDFNPGDLVTFRGQDLGNGQEIAHCVIHAERQAWYGEAYTIECFSNFTAPTTTTTIYDPDNCTTPEVPPDYSNMYHTCSVTDGTDLSSRFTYGFRDGSDGDIERGCMCACGDDLCLNTEVCTLHDNGTGVCTRPGPYPEWSTPAPTVGAKGDPHLVNLQGEHFDINHEGKFELIRLPQAAERPPEFSLLATIQPDLGKPCTTYITQVEFSGAWLGGRSLQIRCYRRSHTNSTDAFLGARLLEGAGDHPWQTIHEFGSEDLVLSESGSRFEAVLDKATWSPKKRSASGPTAAGMFTLSLRNRKSTHSAKITIRQDLPEQEHLNVAVRRLSQLGRVDIGGLLGFDRHPESLERPSAACVHHKATARYRIESQDEDHGYYYRPAWKDRWDQIRRGRSQGDDDNEASAFLLGRADSRAGGSMCKCQSGDNPGTIEGVLVEEASNMWAEASWE